MPGEHSESSIVLQRSSLSQEKQIMKERDVGNTKSLVDFSADIAKPRIPFVRRTID